MFTDYFRILTGRLCPRLGAVKRSKMRSQCGVVLAELAITLIVLFTLIAGVVDIGRALNDYLIATRSLYEGVRYAATLRDLPSCTPGDNACYTTMNASDPYVALIRDRMERVLANHNYLPGMVTIVTKIDKVPSSLAPSRPGDPAINYRTIEIEITLPFDPTFSLIPIRTITSRISASDLAPDFA